MARSDNRGPRGPLAGRYSAAVALVVFALVPFLTLTASLVPLAPVVSRSVGLTAGQFDLTIGLSDAAYAFGTVLSVQLAQHLPGRRMLLVYVTVFVCAALLALWAPSPGVFAGALIVEGLCTSLMLIAAVPPLVTGWPPQKMPWTGGVMNLCIFGAVAVGPTIGELEAAAKSWRPLFAVVAGVAVLALLFSLLTFEDQPPQDTDAPWDIVAIVLAGAGCAAAFFGAAEVELRAAITAEALAPLVIGIALIACLVVYEYRLRRPLMPVRQLATTLPVFGVATAMCASAASFGLMELTLGVLRTAGSPRHTAVLFLPEFVAALAAAAIFGLLFRTRFTPVLALAGLLLLAAAAGLLAVAGARGDVPVALSTGLIGLGVGASVSPALFIAGFSLRSAQIQRIFALVELLRGVGAFLFAPILVFVAGIAGSNAAGGTRIGILICLATVAAGFLFAIALLRLGGRGLQVPDLERWQEGDPAWDSPPLAARLRGRTPGPANPPAPAPARRTDPR